MSVIRTEEGDIVLLIREVSKCTVLIEAKDCTLIKDCNVIGVLAFSLSLNVYCVY